MKIVSWNCNMAFRKKYEVIQSFNPDIAIIQECEDKICFQEYKEKIKYHDIYWYGMNKNKGLGVLTFGKYKINILNHNKDYKYIIPFEISDGASSITLIAVWTQMVNKDIYESYVVQAARSIVFYDKLLNSNKVIYIGDFNSNAIWDHESSKGYTHSQMVQLFLKKDIHSLYHIMKNEDHGKETIPTLYLHRNKNKPYHVDYCFCKNEIIKKVRSFEIGMYEKFILQSDHMPLYIDIK